MLASPAVRLLALASSKLLAQRSFPIDAAPSPLAIANLRIAPADCPQAPAPTPTHLPRAVPSRHPPRRPRIRRSPGISSTAVLPAHPATSLTMSGSSSDPERDHALEEYKGKLLESREWEAKLKALRLEIKGLQHDFDVSEDNIKALQSVGQIIGEVLKQLDEERCTSPNPAAACCEQHGADPY